MPRPRRNPKDKKYFRGGREYKTITKYVEKMKAGEDVTLTKCAEEAGYSPAYANQAAVRIRKDIQQSEFLQQKMMSMGIGIDALAEDIKRLRRATMPRRMCKFCKGFGDVTLGDDEVKCPHCLGKGYFDDPDNVVRQKNSEFHAKLLDALPSQKIDVNQRVLNVHISVDTIEKIRKTKEMLGG